jgi:hypothetical protein
LEQIYLNPWDMGLVANVAMVLGECIQKIEGERGRERETETEREKARERGRERQGEGEGGRGRERASEVGTWD